MPLKHKPPFSPTTENYILCFIFVQNCFSYTMIIIIRFKLNPLIIYNSDPHGINVQQSGTHLPTFLIFIILISTLL
ncbi:hypothetical protein FWK35_00005518 [Aphis craccivora]|uniref:Uncharacterized protein n=1 Tax=Aphis craccivora TaxID=307492 RepID=A0A6G0Z2M1_APHCR|nr:hypothetical protein FWK35_00005518 [Aphis craccivora]